MLSLMLRRQLLAVATHGSTIPPMIIYVQLSLKLSWSLYDCFYFRYSIYYSKDIIVTHDLRSDAVRDIPHLSPMPCRRHARIPPLSQPRHGFLLLCQYFAFTISRAGFISVHSLYRHEAFFGDILELEREIFSNAHVLPKFYWRFHD